MASFRTTADLHRLAHQHLTAQPESAGFFLASYQPELRQFRLQRWRAIPSAGFKSRSDHHLVLADDLRAEIIKWAWDSGTSLIEAHSHDLGMARFSPSDLSGLHEWVPHLWWRLQGRPYAAIVIDRDMFDGLAWIDGTDLPEQVASIEIDESGPILATGLTLQEEEPARRRGRI